MRDEEEVEDDERGGSVVAVTRGGAGTKEAVRASYVTPSAALLLLFCCNAWESMRNIPRVLTSSRRSQDVLEEDDESVLRPDFGTSFCK